MTRQAYCFFGDFFAPADFEDDTPRFDYCYIVINSTFTLPIRVSAGLAVIGLSGKTRITLTPRFIKRVSAIRADSTDELHQQGSKPATQLTKGECAASWAVPSYDRMLLAVLIS